MASCAAVLIATLVLALLSLPSLAHAASASAWASRTIYQVLTDRAALPGMPSPSACSNLSTWCGGTLQGLIKLLPYIRGMGFDAIWLGPVVLNTEGGYHGYWAANLYEIDPHIGTSTDLQAFVHSAHAMGMLVMLDVVANHMGCACATYCSPICFDFAPLVPFNQNTHYHASCLITDWSNQTQVELCRLAGLPDLNQSNAYVSNALLQWVAAMVANYSFDGLRIDTACEVLMSWWPSFVSAAGVFAIGEVDNPNASYVAPYQGPLPSVLNYPSFYVIRQVFQQQMSFTLLVAQHNLTRSLYTAPALLGSFVDNHDNPRFLNGSSDVHLYANALTYVLTALGIPIIYYGSEQAFTGGNDPYCRESLWPHYNTSATLYTLIACIMAAKSTSNWTAHMPVDVAVDASFYCYVRGSAIVALTNVGSQGSISRTVSLGSLFPIGTRFCNVFWPQSDCFTLQAEQPVYLDNGESKVYLPVTY